MNFFSPKIWTVIFIIFSMMWIVNCSDENNPVVSSESPKWQAINNGIGMLTVQSIAVDPNDNDHIIVGTLAGVYTTSDAGASWDRIGRELESQDAKCVAIHPIVSAVLFVGTWGKGVFKSSDGGASWQVAWLQDADPRITTLYFQSGSPPQLYAGTDNGLYKSGDQGTSWTRVFDYGTITAVSVAPDNPHYIIIGVRLSGVFISEDDGENWSRSNTGLFVSYDGYASPNAIIYQPLDSNRVVISTGWVDLYQSENLGKSWQQFAEPLTERHICSLAVDDNNPQRLWAASADYGLFRSTDGGKTWNEHNEGLDTSQLKCIVLVHEKETIAYLGTVGKGIYKFVDRES
jgi:photosystem II stability/assembly factor-like uncharacterized protein